MTSPIHLCLISGQPIPNLLPILQENAQQAIFFVTPEMTSQANRLQKVLKNHGCAVEPIPIPSAYDFEQVAEECSRLLDRYGARLILNVTGGTKISALAAFQSFFFADCGPHIVYCDTSRHRLLQLAPENRETPLADNLLTVRDYLSCYGMPPTNRGTLPTNAPRRAPHLRALADLFINDTRLLARWNTALEGQNKQKDFANINLPALGRGAEKLAAILEKCGAGQRTQTDNLHVSGEEHLFFCKGGWLEEYVFQTMRELALPGADARINVEVAWEGEGRKETTNEFDVLFTYNNRLHLISCKASNPDRVTASGTRATEALNELETLADRAGGLYGRAMLVSARPLSEYDRSRAEKMRVELVDGKKVLRLAEHLQQWR